MIAESLTGLPAFAAYFAAALALTALFVAVYVRITPYPELQLIRQGNTAAALSLGGATLGFVIPLASAIEHSVSLPDMLIWGAVAFVAQVIVFFLVRLLLPTLYADIAANKTSAGVWLGVCALAGGVLNAACMTY
jgi:putative membrane protein